MPRCQFAIARGLNAATLTNVEDIVYPPDGPPHVLDSDEASFSGPVVRRTLSKRVQRNGTNYDRMHWDVLSQRSRNALIEFLFNDSTTDNADVTYRTIDEEGGYSTFTGTMQKPVPGDDYRNQGNGVHKRDFTLTFARFSALGEFTAEFTSEFVR